MLLGKTEEDKRTEELEGRIKSKIEIGAIRVRAHLQGPVKGWSALCAIKKRNDPQDSSWMDERYLKENELFFLRKIAVANIETVLQTTSIASEVQKLPSNRRSTWMEKLSEEFQEALSTEAGPKSRNPVQVCRIKNIPLNGLDVATFLETQRETLIKERARVDSIYKKLNMLNDEVMLMIKAKEESEQDESVKKFISALRQGADSAYKNQQVPSSYLECSEYIETADNLINSAMFRQFSAFDIKVPMLMTDTNFMHMHGSDAHYFKR